MCQKERSVESVANQRQLYLAEKAEQKERLHRARERKKNLQTCKGEGARKQRPGCGKRGSWGLDCVRGEVIASLWKTDIWGTDIVLAPNRKAQPLPPSRKAQPVPPRTTSWNRRLQARLGAQSLRGVRRPDLRPLSGCSHAERVFREMLKREAKHAEHWVVFYHSYNTPALVYEVQAAIASVLFSFSASDGPLPRLMMAPFANIPDAPAMIKKFPSWFDRDLNQEFKQAGICCSTSLVSCDPEATPTRVFHAGYGVTRIGPSVLCALLEGCGVSSCTVSELAFEITSLAAKFGLCDGRVTGSLLQIFVHRSCVDKIAYASFPYGVPDSSRHPLSSHLQKRGPIMGQARLVANPSVFMKRSAVRLYVGCSDSAFHAERHAFQSHLQKLILSKLCGEERSGMQSVAEHLLGCKLPHDWRTLGTT